MELQLLNHEIMVFNQLELIHVSICRLQFTLVDAAWIKTGDDKIKDVICRMRAARTRISFSSLELTFLLIDYAMAAWQWQEPHTNPTGKKDKHWKSFDRVKIARSSFSATAVNANSISIHTHTYPECVKSQFIHKFKMRKIERSTYRKRCDANYKLDVAKWKSRFQFAYTQKKTAKRRETRIRKCEQFFIRSKYRTQSFNIKNKH